MASRFAARSLAVFGIGLGLAELFASRDLARASGLEGRERELRVFGWREIVSGVIILVARRPENWLWMRVAGDALDGILLGSALGVEARRERAWRATMAVAPVVLLDVVFARRRS